MKVAHIIDSTGIYGAENMLICLCREQIAAGLHVMVVSLGKPGEIEKPIEQLLEKEDIPHIRWRTLPLPNPVVSLKIYSTLKKMSVDIVHSHGYKSNILLALIPRSFRPVPAIATVHGNTKHPLFSKMTIYQTTDKLLLRFLSKVVFVSGIQEITIGKFGNSVVVNNGIAEIDPQAVTTDLKLPPFEATDLKLVSLGRLCKEKNFSLLINTMPEVLKVIPNAKLVIYGEGPERATLENQIDSLKLNKYVFLPGFISNPIPLFATSDIYINCSTTEGMPISILEAMRAGAHIVATDIPANRQLLSPLRISNQIVNFDVQEISRAILIHLNKDPETKRRESLHAIKHFRDFHTAKIMERNYNNVYERVLESERLR